MLGRALLHLQRPFASERASRRALEIDPANAKIWLRLGNALSFSGRSAQAMAAYRQAVELSPVDQEALVTLSYYGNSIAIDAATAFADCTRFAATLPRPPACPFNRPLGAHADRALRVGFVSGDLRRHSVGDFVEGFLPHIDRSRFRVFVYFTGPQTDERSLRIRQSVDVWR